MRVRKAGAALLLLCACARGVPASSTTDVTFQTSRGRLVIHAEIARTEAERERGLMGRTSLASDAGMIFLWQDVAARDFYMKDTLIPLDLISIRTGRVVGVATMVPCRTPTCPITKTPATDAVLEVAAGTAERAGITAGALVSWK